MTDDELRQLFESIRQQNAEMRQDIATIRQENAAAHVETRRHFEVASEQLRSEMQLVAEAVQVVDQKLDRTAADIRNEMRNGFSETQAMIKFSYAELDRRVTSLEQRVDRLEKTQAR